MVGRPRAQLDLDLAWRAYIRRFDLEHTVRFAKQTLGWTTPRPRHPAQADRWTWLVLAAYAQLRLARQVAGDQRLPWERPRPQRRLSPVRVRRGFPQTSGHAGLAGRHAETRRALPRPAQGQPLAGPPPATRRSRSPPRGQQEGDHGHEGRLTGSDPPARPPTWSAANPRIRRVKSS